MSASDLSYVRDALQRAGITGTHRSHQRRGSIQKIEKLRSGDPDATFGLSGVEKYSTEVVLQGFNGQLTMLDGRAGGGLQEGAQADYGADAGGVGGGYAAEV